MCIKISDGFFFCRNAMKLVLFFGILISYYKYSNDQKFLDDQYTVLGTVVVKH